MRVPKYTKHKAIDKKLPQDVICVSFIYKNYRQLLRIDPKTDFIRQVFILEREYFNFLKDLKSPFIRNKYNLDDE